MRLLLPGGEPFFLPGGSTGCLLIHGFTASPQEMRRLGEHLAGEGHTVLGLRLPGHASTPPDMLPRALEGLVRYCVGRSVPAQRHVLAARTGGLVARGSAGPAVGRRAAGRRRRRPVDTLSPALRSAPGHAAPPDLGRALLAQGAARLA